jgi:hypothetical protein
VLDIIKICNEQMFCNAYLSCSVCFMLKSKE